MAGTETKFRRKPSVVKPDDGRLRENKGKKPPNVVREDGLPELLDHQRMVISVPDDHWLIMAGGRGGGKSWVLALLLVRDAIRYGKSFNGALLRTDLTGLKKLQILIEDFCNKLPQLAGSRYLTGQRTFEFSNGARLQLGYLKDEVAFAKWQGADLSHIAIDEIAQIPDPAPVLRLCSSLRTTDPNVKPRLLATGNPGNAGSLWLFESVISRSQPWVPFNCQLFQHSTVVCHSTVHDNSFIDTETYVATLRASSNNDPARVLAEVWGRLECNTRIILRPRPLGTAIQGAVAWRPTPPPPQLQPQKPVDRHGLRRESPKRRGAGLPHSRRSHVA